MQHSFFVRSSVYGHLGCFHVLPIVNSASMKNVYTCISFNFGFLRVYVQEQDCWVIWWFYFQFCKVSPYHLLQWLYQFTLPPTVQECSLFSTPSPAFIVCRLFDGGYSDWCEGISHFSNNEQCWASFHVFVRHLQVFFGEMSVYVFSHFLIGLFFCH